MENNDIGASSGEGRAIANGTASVPAVPASVPSAAELITRLWDILDDIDTADDIAKGDDKLYRELVGKLQAKRWETGITTDGYGLTIPATPYDERGVHMQHCGPLNDGVCKYGDADCPACDTAQGTEARRGETSGSTEGDGPVAKPCAPGGSV